MKNVGGVIRQKRNEMNLTLEQLATLIGTTKSYLSRIENNRIERPGVDILKKLSKQLDIDFNTLMVYSGYIESPKQSKVDFNLPNDSIIKASSLIKVEGDDIWIRGQKLDIAEQQRFLKMIYNMEAIKWLISKKRMVHGTMLCPMEKILLHLNLDK